MAPASKSRGGKQPATSYLMTATGAILFQSNYGRLPRWFRNHAAFVYLVGDGSGRLLGYREYQPGSVPNLYTVALRKNLGFRDGLFIVGARQRLVASEVTVIAHSVSAILRHHRRLQAGRFHPFLHVHSCLRLPGLANEFLMLHPRAGRHGLLCVDVLPVLRGADLTGLMV
jgi:hypothetical protein